MRTVLRVMLSAGLLAPALMLTACFDRPTAWSLPPLAASPIHGRWVQRLTLMRGSHRLDLMAVIENDGSVFTLVGLSPFGQRLIRITWSQGCVHQETDPRIPVAIDGLAILRDVVVVHWPQQALQTVFANSDWRLIVGDHSRILTWQGRPWLEIHTDLGEPGEPGDPGDPTSRTVVINHVVEGYVVRVTTVERDDP
jgi:hypothetical protein